MKHVISPYQVFLLHFIGTLAILIIFTPAVVVRQAGNDAWLAMLGAGLVGTLVVSVAYYVMLQLRGESLVSGLAQRFGPWPARLLVLPVLAYLLLATGVHLHSTMIMVNVGFLKVTPVAVLVMLTALCGAYIAGGGLETVARFHEAIVVVVTAFVLMLLVPLSPLVDLDAVKPVLYQGLGPVARGVSDGSTHYFELLIFLFCAAAVRPSPRVLGAAVAGVWAASAINALWAVSALGLFGAEQTARFIVPYLVLIRAVTVGEFFERVESIVITLWLFGVMARAGLLIYMCAALFYGLVGWRQSLAWPVAWAAAAVALIAIIGWPTMASFLTFKGQLYPFLGAGAVLYVGLMGVSLHAGRRLVREQGRGAAAAPGAG